MKTTSNEHLYSFCHCIDLPYEKLFLPFPLPDEGEGGFVPRFAGRRRVREWVCRQRGRSGSPDKSGQAGAKRRNPTPFYNLPPVSALPIISGTVEIASARER
ncbi:MAG: hypothetical protein GF315_05580 [candidate division Zixibacteria bacterium]|nr:hypothetical protein [candidate division Zixibacteria bacterium]